MHPIRPWLFIGKYRDMLNPSNLVVNQIKGVLQLEDPQELPDVHSLYLPIQDGAPLVEEDFWRGIQFILLEHQLGRNVVIACAAGISRSVTFAVAVLKETENLTLLEAYRQIVQGDAAALPHPVLWESLCRIYNVDIPYVEVLKIYNKVAY
ncbi:dual specificity protein phosphatase family protein [Pontibacter sp. CAU 1760]